jgi:hypothetical protein
MTCKTPTVLILLLIISSGLSFAKSDTLKIGDKTFTIAPSTKAEFDKIPSMTFDTSEKENLARDIHNVKRNGDTLFFKLRSGKFATLVNRDMSYESGAIYFYVKALQQIGQYYVSGGGYEWPINALINMETGDTTWIDGRPIVSPDKKFLICGNNDVLGLVGFALYEISNNKLDFIGSINKERFSNIKWYSNRIRQNVFEIVELRITGSLPQWLE